MNIIIKNGLRMRRLSTSIDKKNLLTYGVQFRRQEAISTRINNGSIAWSRTREGITDTAGKATINYGSYLLLQHQWALVM